MNSFRYATLTLVLTVLALHPAQAQFNNVGTSAANFLKIPVGPRGAAVGGAFTALADDASSLYWNVAGMAGVAGNEVSLSTNVWLLDLRHDFLAGVFSLGNYNRIGLSLSYLSYGDDMEETTPEQPQGTGLFFSAYDLAVGLAYARQVTDRFSFGGQVKYVRESISQSAASGAAFDLGLLYRSEWNDLRIGAAIANFGPDLRIQGGDLRQNLDPFPATGANPDDVPLFLETKQYSLPILFQVGASVKPLQMESFSLTTMLDVRDARDYNQEVRLGGEVEIMNTLFLRGGANLFMIEGNLFGGGGEVVVDGQDNPDNTGIGNVYRNPTTITRANLREGQPVFNLGAGLNIFLPGTRTGFRFDYAFSKIKLLDDVHRFGITLAF